MNNNDKKISWNNKIMNKFTKIKKLQIFFFGDKFLPYWFMDRDIFFIKNADKT